MRVLMVLMLSAVSPALGQEPNNLERLTGTRSLRCEFSVGAMANWGDRGARLEEQRSGFTLHFDAIDLGAGTARLIGNQGAVDVGATRSGPAITFVEFTPIGYIMVTTVFASYQPGSAHFTAVTSRHLGFGIPGPPPMPSQYYGACRVMQ